MAKNEVQQLRIPAIDKAVVRELKMQAIEQGKSLQQRVIELLEKATSGK
jgi:predicted HicB family RNase H-like nuclease